MEELVTLAQGDGGPLAADTNAGFGLFYLGGEKRMLAMDSKVRESSEVMVLLAASSHDVVCTRCYYVCDNINILYFEVRALVRRIIYQVQQCC